MRSNEPGYDKLTIVDDFNYTGVFYFCWYPVFMQDKFMYSVYDFIHNLKWTVQYEPTISASFRTSAVTNQDMLLFDMQGTFIDGDSLAMSWKGYIYSDCNPTNILGSSYTFNHSHWPGVWLGYNTGINGIQNSSMDDL